MYVVSSSYCYVAITQSCLNLVVQHLSTFNGKVVKDVAMYFDVALGSCVPNAK